jgi:hypothetical protein
MKHDDVFEVLEPPPGGLTRLRARVSERTSRRRAALSLATAVGAVCVLVLWVKPAPPPPLWVAAQALVAPPSEPVEARGATAVEQLPSSNPQVVIYRVSSLEPSR